MGLRMGSIIVVGLGDSHEGILVVSDGVVVLNACIRAGLSSPSWVTYDSTPTRTRSTQHLQLGFQLPQLTIDHS